MRLSTIFLMFGIGSIFTNIFGITDFDKSVHFILLGINVIICTIEVAMVRHAHKKATLSDIVLKARADRERQYNTSREYSRSVFPYFEESIMWFVAAFVCMIMFYLTNNILFFGLVYVVMLYGIAFFIDAIQKCRE